MTPTWSRLSSIAIALAALLLVASGDVSPGPLDPQFRSDRVFFHCSSTKASNVQFLADASIPGWDRTAPSQSASAGAGCATADPATPEGIDPQENAVDGVWRGSFTGNLDAFTVHAYCLGCAGTARLDDAGEIRVRVKIDGVAMTDGTRRHTLTAAQENAGLTQLYEFSVTQLGLIEANDDLDGDGIGDNPYGSIEHTITLTLEGASPLTNTFGVWAFDTTEVPSGITFNPTNLAPTRIPSTFAGAGGVGFEPTRPRKA